MKKLPLLAQITLLFFISISAACALLTVLTLRQLDATYENAVFQSLQSEAKSLRLSENTADYQPKPDMAFIVFDFQNNTYIASKNILHYLSERGIELLVNAAADQSQGSMKYKHIVEDKVIYYVVDRYQGLLFEQGRLYIVLSDISLKKHFIQQTAIRLIVSSAAAFLAGFLMLFLWSRRLVKSVLQIKGQVECLGRNHYRSQVFSRRKDEIGDLADEIEKMRQKLSENEKEKQNLIQGISHDLKTPIAVIHSYAVAIEDEMCEPKQAAQIVLKQSERLSKKVSKLLSLTRLGYLSIHADRFVKVKMKTLIEELVTEYTYLTDAHFNFRLKETEFYGEREAWKVVIENILDNAIRYARNRIEIVLLEDSLTISNDGEPIDQAVMETLFNPYKKSKDGKFGLGLSIVKQAVELFGFHVKAKNVEEGVCFSIQKNDGLS